MSGKTTFTSFAISPGTKIYRLPLQAFPNFWVCAYLVQRHGDNYLIDCGSGMESSHEDLLHGLKEVGLSPADLSYILLTHAHIDHHGGLSVLKPLTTAKIGCQELDVQTVAYFAGHMALMSRRLASFLADTGLAEETREQLLGISRFSQAFYRSVPVDFTYESRNMQLGPFEIIHLPGHCAGHVALRLEEVVFCGDMVVEGVTPHLFPETIQAFNGLDHYLDSLVRLEEWSKGANLVLNGHDDPILDLRAHIEETYQNILRRMRRAVEALREPLTIAQICLAVYGEADSYNKLLMIEKTGAYVEYLYDRGLIEITNSNELEEGRPARYLKLREIEDEEILPNKKAPWVE